MDATAIWAIQGTAFQKTDADRSYYVDFVSVRAKLVIEVDGSQHYEDDAIAYDERRTRMIESLGYKVMRVPTAVMHELEGVSIMLLAAVGK